MRNVITTIAIWAIILGLFMTGVKVLANNPQGMNVQSIEWTNTHFNVEQVEVDRADSMASSILPSNEGRVTH